MRALSRSAISVFVLAGSGVLAPQTPTIKVTTQLVQLSVVVHDRSGKPASDLTKDDFEVKDAGKLQTVSLFSIDRASGEPKAGPAAQTLPKNFATNRPITQAGGPASVTIVLIDTYNTSLTDQVYANRQLAKFLKQVRPEDQIAIYTLNSSGFGIVHDFTNNADSLQAALTKSKLRFSHQLDGSSYEASNTGDDTADALLDEQNIIMANFFTRSRVMNTCAALKALADHLSGIPGRKNLVWLTGSMPIDIGFGDPEDVMSAKKQMGGAANEQEQFAPYIEDTSKALNTANVAVYPVDARGLLGVPFADASKNIKLDPRTHGVPPSLLRVDNRNVMTMDYVAELTGGRAFHDTNDLASAVRTAIDDSAVTYTLGYYVQEGDWDNRYHKIKVTVKRPGLKIRTKKGYLAQDKPPLSTGQLDNLLRSAVWSPLDSTRLAVTARIDPSPAKPNASRFAFVLLPGEIQFRQADGKFHGDLDVLLVQERKRGERISDVKRNLNIALTPERFKEIAKNGLVLTEDLPIEADTVAVRIIVLDRFSSAMGSVTMPVEAKDKSAAAP